MSYTTEAKNLMLDALVLGTMSLHSGFPGTTGANEISGGAPAYARKACVVNSASGSVRALNAAVVFDIGAGTTVRWVGFWDGVVFRAYSPSGGNPKEFQVDTAADTVSVPSHGYADTAPIVFYGDTVPGGLVEGTVYYVRDALTNTFAVAATPGGAVLPLSTQGGAACTVSVITETVYAAQDTHTIGSGSFGLPN